MSADALRWTRRNLFANAADSVLSLVAIPLLAWLAVRAAAWAAGTARWSVIGDSIRVLLVGTYPAGQTWRAWTAGALLALAASVTALCWRAIARSPRLGRGAAGAWLATGAAAFAILAQPGLDLWGGLLLSVMLTTIVSAATLPLGVLLALGRQSRTPSIRICCTGYIEAMRSVPLIMVVYWVWISVPLLAPGTNASGLLRGMLGYSAFYSAYVAEYVRSGLQAVPRGQVEAARSLGMGEWAVTGDIVLPQAIRVVLPALVGNVLDIFNGATLVFIIGLTDFLRAGQMILADPSYGSPVYEVYAFMFTVYFTIGSLITFAARRLEARLGRGTA